MKSYLGKVEGVNRSRGEVGETIHHLLIAPLKGYLTPEVYTAYKNRYKECVCMLNWLERALEQNFRSPNDGGESKRKKPRLRSRESSWGLAGLLSPDT